MPSNQHQPNHYTLNRGSKIPRTTLRSHVKLERTHRQKKKKIDLKTKEINWLIRNILSLYTKQITHLQSGNQTEMELRIRTVGLRQQVQHSHRAEIPNQNSQSHSKCTPVCNTNLTLHTDFNIPYVSDVIHQRMNKHHIKLEVRPNPPSEPLLQPVNNGRLKRCWPFDLQGT